MRAVRAVRRVRFILAEAAVLLPAMQLSGSRDDGMRQPVWTKLVEADQNLGEITAVRGTLRADLDAGRNDLIACIESSRCPLPFANADAIHKPLSMAVAR